MLTLLIKNRLDSQLGISRYRYGTDEKKKRNQVLMLVLIVFVALVGMGYVGGYSYLLYIIGLADIIPMFGYVISCIICLVFTAIKTNGELFAFKDYDMLTALPVKTTTLIGSRVIVLYIWNMFLTLLVMVPAMIIYMIFGHPRAVYFFLVIPGIVLTAFLPTVIAVVFGAGLTAIASKFRYYQAVQSLLVILLAVVVFSSSFVLTGNPGNIFNADGSFNKPIITQMIEHLSEDILTYVYPARWFQKGFVEGEILSLFVFIAVSVAAYAGFLFILAKFFGKINTAITTHHANSNYKITHMEQKGVLTALYKKELKYYSSCSIYLTNTIIGAVMAIIFSAGLLIWGVDRMMLTLKVRENMENMKAVLPWFAWMFLIMTNTTCCSLSLEGKRMWILKSLPLERKIIYDSKILVNLTACFPASVICSVLLCIALTPDFILGIFYFLTPLVLCTLSAVWGIFVNQKITQLEWESELKVVKQSATTALGMFPGMFLALILGSIQLFLPLDNRIYLAFVFLLALGATLFIYLKRKDVEWTER